MTKSSRTGLNMKNAVDRTAVRSLIELIWPLRRWRCEAVRRYGGRALFSFDKWSYFSAIRRQIGRIIWHRRAL